jgi:hypothetical protein
MRRAPFWLLVTSVVAGGGCHRKEPAATPAPVSAPAAPPPADAAEPLDPATVEDRAVLAKVSAAFVCFEREMKKSHQEPAFARYGRTSFTDVFFFDRVFGDRATLLDQSENAICEAVVKDYRALFQATLQKTANTGSAASAAEGVPLPVDGESEFIRAARGRTGLHLLWHADVTRAALLETTRGQKRPVFNTIRYGAERTDIYRWSDLRYHAQTSPCEAATCEVESSISQEAFVGFVASAIHDFNEQARQGSFDQAALHLGVACHAIQDAVLHHGMTRRQLAGLRFLGDRDFYDAGMTAATAEARRWTKQILILARAAIHDEKIWDAFMAWTPPPRFDLAKVANAVFSDDAFNVHLSAVDLTRHWLLHRAYRRNPALKTELEGGLVKWEVGKLLEKIRRSVENGGVALGRPQPAR